MSDTMEKKTTENPNLNVIMDDHLKMMLELERKDFQAQIDNRLTHAFLGMVSEIGEIATAIKSTGCTHKPLDLVNVFEESGDFLWFYRLFLYLLGFDLGGVAIGNVNKLRKRYGKKFSVEKFENRDREAERKVLEEENQQQITEGVEASINTVPTKLPRNEDFRMDDNLYCSVCGRFVLTRGQTVGSGQPIKCPDHPDAIAADVDSLRVRGITPWMPDGEEKEEDDGVSAFDCWLIRQQKHCENRSLAVYTEQATKHYPVVLKVLKSLILVVRNYGGDVILLEEAIMKEIGRVEEAPE